MPLPFSPTILEHAAATINQTPSACALNAALLAQAHITAYHQYHPATVTIGMDIYNIEAEALGCTVRFYTDNSIPGIVTRPQNPTIQFSKSLGRIQLLLNAAAQVKSELNTQTTVSIAICGPFSILIELLGFETALDNFYDQPDHTHHLLHQLLNFQKAYCAQITALGLGAVVFESWASPPLVSPAMYREFALPYETQLFAHMKELGLPACPLVIGGDTSNIADDMLTSGATTLLSDYNTPLNLYIQKAREKNLPVRANIDPKLLLAGDWQQITNRVQEIYTAAKEYPKLIIGSGVVPYDTPPANLLRVKEIIKECDV